MGDFDFTYTGPHLKEARFPLGGIGAGSVSIDGGARLVDWEIMNRPNKESYNGFSHIAVKAESKNGSVCAKVLNGPLPPPYMGRGLHSFGGYTYGPARETLGGVPHFDNLVLKGRFPVAEYSFAGDFPAEVSLNAWSPFEPANENDSSLPTAVFEVCLKNTAAEAIEYTAAFSLANPDRESPVNRVIRRGDLTVLTADTGGKNKNQGSFGHLCVATDAKEVYPQQNWYRGRSFDGLRMFWKDFTKPGVFTNRVLPPVREVIESGGRAPFDHANTWMEHGTLCARARVMPGETAEFRFILTWYYPNYEVYWGPVSPGPDQTKVSVRNWYAGVFRDAAQVAEYVFNKYQTLREKAWTFAETLAASTLPAEVKDAASSTLAVLKSPVCVRLTDGSFWGWEGAHAREGSCFGSCQNVWNYQYALPMLFPALERTMRELDYRYNVFQDGIMMSRIELPLGTPSRFLNLFRGEAGGASVDGMLGGLIKTYREWILSGDDHWLAGLWPCVKRTLEYVWDPHNMDKWDPEGSGVLSGRQLNTLDVEIFGPSSWIQGLYLAALDASARMAAAMGEEDFALRCREIREKGRIFLEESLWNGEYYIQAVDLKDRSLLEKFPWHGPASPDDYWDEESGEIKYQIGQGCSIDQCLGQWHADLTGLDPVFEASRTRNALKALYRYNFYEKMGELFNPCRIYGLQDEAGLVICSCPETRKCPAVPIRYAEETMHGFEYAAACQMIQNGLEEEGLRCVRAVRKRYDGERRNPWNEIECGGNYARSMAAWSLVMAFQGLRVDMRRKAAAFARLNPGEEHSSLWAFSGAWGRVRTGGGKFTLSCYGGSLTLKSIALAPESKVRFLNADGESLPLEAVGETEGIFMDLAFFIFPKTVTLIAGKELALCQEALS
jgi:uncharacterized protein (DUF608 family)